MDRFGPVGDEDGAGEKMVPLAKLELAAPALRKWKTN